jgi:hypothetical protein
LLKTPELGRAAKAMAASGDDLAGEAIPTEAGDG